MKNATDFFLGANTAHGFSSLFDELYNPYDSWRAYIIKGGPGTGKSGMMKHIAQLCIVEGMVPQRVWCSSDPDSLDALIFDEIKVCIADGTSPHTIEPRFPGAVETIVNLGEFWDSEQLRSRKDDIIRLTTENSSMHRRCMRFMEASFSLCSDVTRLAAQSVDGEKVERYASRLAARKFGTPRGRVGTEKKRMLSALTPQGIVSHDSTVEALCGDILIIDDDYGAVSKKLVSLLRSYALGNGLDVISCVCPVDTDDEAEHILVPEADFAVVTSNSRHKFDYGGAIRIRASRFTDSKLLREHKCRIAFSKRTEKELLDEAVDAMRQAKGIHDELEKMYIPAMDFARVTQKAEQLADEIISG